MKNLITIAVLTLATLTACNKDSALPKCTDILIEIHNLEDSKRLVNGLVSNGNITEGQGRKRINDIDDKIDDLEDDLDNCE